MRRREAAIVEGDDMCVLAGNHYMWDKMRGLVPGIIFYRPTDKKVPSKSMKPRDIWQCLKKSEPSFVCISPYVVRKMMVNGKTVLNETDERALLATMAYEGGYMVINAAALRMFTHREDGRPFAPHLTTYAGRGKVDVELTSFASNYLENILAAIGFSNSVTYRSL